MQASTTARSTARAGTGSAGLTPVLATLAALLATPATPAAAATPPAGAPQVLLAVTNSESMDGTTNGAIMVGSGSLGTGYSNLTNSSSPTNYTIPTGFTPPLAAGTGGVAPYTVTCNTSQLCDNGPSRLNMAKLAIQHVLTNYGSAMFFGLYDYSTQSINTPTTATVDLYATWVYYMSPNNGFTFTNTVSASTVTNPCYGYLSGGYNSVYSSCSQMAGLYNAATLNSNLYMNVAATSDSPLINDVLYGSTTTPTATSVTYNGPSPTNPITYYGLYKYNTALTSYWINYTSSLPPGGPTSTSPTNAGYVGTSPQVMYALRGFGYGSSQSATTGNVVVGISSSGNSSTAFATALAPETNYPKSSEIKSGAGQSALYGLLTGAKSYLSTVSTTSCQTQTVVLLTDGLPTMDSNGWAWPPLGTTTANAYNLTATYNADGSFAASNSKAVTDAITAITNLKNAGIKVYVVGLGAGVNTTSNPSAASLLTAMAIAGGTSSYFPAASMSALDAAFQAIAYQIYTEGAVAAPLAPLSLTGSAAYSYEMSTVAAPGAAHVRAYAINTSGQVSTTASWDASTQMTAAGRATALMSTDTSGNVVPLSSLDSAAFALSSPTGCVPNTATIVNYTINPAGYSTSSCAYLNGRDSTSWVGPFTSQNTGAYVGPPASTVLAQAYGATYPAWVQTAKTRSPMVMFTSSDGFLYAVDASTGALDWAWISRNQVDNLQSYSTFASSAYTNGNFTVVDAMDANGAWASYVIGSQQSGAEHFSLKLNTNGTPLKVVYDAVVTNATTAGDKAGVAGTLPSRQPPVVAYIGSSAYYVYVSTVGTTSTLYETNVATGATTSATLNVQVSSALTYDRPTGRLVYGGANGTVWALTLQTGNATTDLAKRFQIGTTVVPSTGVANPNVLYAGYTTVQGVPYYYALNSAQLTVFGVGSAGWVPLWTTTPTQGWTYITGSWVKSSTVNTLTASSFVTDFPLVITGTTSASLLVPVTVQGSACNSYVAWYDYFDLGTGVFATGISLSYQGATVAANQRIGVGYAFTPTLVYMRGSSSGTSATGSTDGTVSLVRSSSGDLTPTNSTDPSCTGTTCGFDANTGNVGTLTRSIGWRRLN